MTICKKKCEFPLLGDDRESLVVVKDVPRHAVVAGNLAKILRLLNI